MFFLFLKAALSEKQGGCEFTIFHKGFCSENSRAVLDRKLRRKFDKLHSVFPLTFKTSGICSTKTDQRSCNNKNYDWQSFSKFLGICGDASQKKAKNHGISCISKEFLRTFFICCTTQNIFSKGRPLLGIGFPELPTKTVL